MEEPLPGGTLPSPHPPAPDARAVPSEAATLSGPAAVGPDTCPVPEALAAHPRYRLLELLGSGGMGSVYRAEHRRMERQVALKVMSPALMDRPEMVERFHREVKAAALLSHPNIVTAYDADQAADTHFLIMEFVEGISLAQKVKQDGPLPVPQACACARQAALGLQHAFERGMVHRDVKPHNLMLTPAGQVKVLDFGLARLMRETTSARAESGPATPEAPSHAALTATGALMGTADFIAPEQAMNSSAADARADIYSLGCTLYYLLAGHAPFPEGTALDKLTAHCERQPKPLTELRRDIPQALARVVERMMAKDPARRYSTPAEVAEALAPFLPGGRSSRGRTRRLVAVAAGLVLLIGAIFFLWIGKPNSGEQGEKESAREAPPTASRKKGKKRRLVGEGVPARYRASIARGLAYLARAQHADGHWEALKGQDPEAITGLVGMALLMEGSTIEDGQYAEPIRKAVDWLLGRCQPNGLLCGPNGRYLFGHGYALLFLATVYGEEEDGERRGRLEKALTRAVEYTGKVQTSRGGWGYVDAKVGSNFDEGASTIVQLQSLRAARNAGIIVPKKLFDIGYLRKSTRPDGGVVYSQAFGLGGDGRPALTAAALAGMLTAGEYDSDLAQKWLGYCQRTIRLDRPDPKTGHDEYAHFYYAQALYILGETGYEKLFPGSKPAERLTWSKYRDLLFPYLESSQAPDGSWSAAGWVARVLGPVYVTACFLTVLQLDDGTLQIYRR